MKRHSSHRRALALAALAAAGFFAWREWPRATADDPSLIDGRLWVDARPDRHTDYVQAAVFVSAANFGLFERASSYDVRFEFFEMSRTSRSIKLTFPQTDRSAKLTFSARQCDDHKPFDLCLTLSTNPWGGPTSYYGFSRPEDERQALGPLARHLREAAQAGPAP